MACHGRMLELGEEERVAAIHHALAGASLLEALHKSGSQQPDWVDIHEEQFCRYGAIWIREELNRTDSVQTMAWATRALALLDRLVELHKPTPSWVAVYRDEFCQRLAPSARQSKSDRQEQTPSFEQIRFPAVPADPAAAEKLLPGARQRLHQARQAGAHEQGLEWLAQLRQVLGHRTDLLWHTLEAAFPVGDWSLQASCAEQLLQEVGPEQGPAHRHLLFTRWQALLRTATEPAPGCPDLTLAALGALAAHHGATDRSDAAFTHPMAWLLLQSAQLAQRRGQLDTARSLCLALAALDSHACSPQLRLQALQLAEPLAYMGADLEQAKALRRRIGSLQSTDAERFAEPFRPWLLELGADRSALERLQAIQLLPIGTERLEALAEALHDHPKATVLAFGLLQALREATVANTFTPEPGVLIPRRLWLLQRHSGCNNEQRERERHWLDLHPGWSSEWLDPAQEAIAGREALPQVVHLACHAVNSDEVRADLLRLALLWQHGGLSVVWDSRPQRSLEPMLTPGTSLLLATDSLGSLGLDAIAAVPRHPFVKAALEEACRRVLRGEGFSRWELSGACLLSCCFADWVVPHLRTPQSHAFVLPAGLRLLSWAELQGWLSLGIPLPRPHGAAEEPAWTGLIDDHRRLRALRALKSQP